MTYSEKLKDPRWQKKRLEILQRDGFACRACYRTDQTLHVHHCFYKKGTDPWDYPNDSLVTLCYECHEEEPSELKNVEADLINILNRNGWISTEIWILANLIMKGVITPQSVWHMDIENTLSENNHVD